MSSTGSCILTESGAVVGSRVQLETILGAAHEGAVLSLDRKYKVMFLHTQDEISGKPMVRLFNTNNLKSLKNIKSPDEQDIQYIESKKDFLVAKNPQMMKTSQERLQKSLSETMPMVMQTKGVSLRGQQAYIQLKRTIADTRWSGEDIRVLGLVVVHKPYGVSDVTKDAEATGFDDSRATSAVAQVQKVLSKPFTEYKTHHQLDFTVRPAAATAGAK